MTVRIAVIDHGAGNLVSIAQGLAETEAVVTVVTRGGQIGDVDGVVLPGVGATGTAMRRLNESGLIDDLKDLTLPLLGICVGMQLFFDTSEEDGGPCLGLIAGRVRALADTPRLPHIGWNDVQTTPDRIFASVAADAPFYFVHSYAPVPEDPSVVIGTADYGTRFTAAVRSGNRVGVQFHPERSGRAGLAVLANFVASCRETADVA